tara:strand:- start:626 stop:757 length:132 start_codon:yes stop_codon:yes gene_type:complete
MNKKIILTFILLTLVVSCGKKGDPIYKESKKEVIVKDTNKKTT